jgi:hypothetical protein
MFYVISFDGCGLESQLRSRSVEAAIALAEEAERNGCDNVMVTAPSGEVLPLTQFALRYGGKGPRPEEA